MIFFKNEKINESNYIISAIKNDETLASCVVSINGNEATATKLSLSDKDAFLLEGVLKTAFNLSANRNVYIAKVISEDYENILLRMGFQKKENVFENDIPTILTGKCCK